MEGEYFALVCDGVPILVVLTDTGPNLLEAVKVVTRHTGLSLWHSKLLLGDLPATLLDDVTGDRAERLITDLRTVGAAAEIRYR
ncbi:ribosomal protein L7/L12 [Streptomyces sp. Y1]|uniref:Ribosomal protein L7/L12 n=1 Tax=Streptomyces sp. Y1 TaxID=3238634 RepID=A0AB39TTT9_9ACTN